MLLLSGTPKPETSFEAALLRGRGTAALSSHLVVCRSARAEEVAATAAGAMFVRAAKTGVMPSVFDSRVFRCALVLAPGARWPTGERCRTL